MYKICLIFYVTIDSSGVIGSMTQVDLSKTAGLDGCMTQSDFVISATRIGDGNWRKASICIITLNLPESIQPYPIGYMVLLYMATFTINIPPMLAYIPIGSMYGIYMLTWLGYIDGIHGTPYIAAPLGSVMGLHRILKASKPCEPEGSWPRSARIADPGLVETKLKLKNAEFQLFSFVEKLWMSLKCLANAEQLSEASWDWGALAEWHHSQNWQLVIISFETLPASKNIVSQKSPTIAQFLVPIPSYPVSISCSASGRLLWSGTGFKQELRATHPLHVPSGYLT